MTLDAAIRWISVADVMSDHSVSMPPNGHSASTPTTGTPSLVGDADARDDRETDAEHREPDAPAGALSALVAVTAGPFRLTGRFLFGVH